MKTFMANAEKTARSWFVVDAAGKPLGRISSEVASILKGKRKPEYTPYVDTGDFVIVINAGKVLLTGNKLDGKIYRHHSNHPGGFKEVKCRDMIARHPERVIELAVKGMLPKNSLGRSMYRKLKVYSGSEHKHQAQKPEQLVLDI